MAPTPPLTQSIGQTEKALRAILARQLTGTGLTENQWVILTMTAMGGGTVGREELAGRVGGVLKVSDAEAEARIDELAGARLLAVPADGSPVTLTDAGQQLHGRIRTAVGEITQRLWGDLPAEDIATAGRVLATVLARADAELAAA